MQCCSSVITAHLGAIEADTVPVTVQMFRYGTLPMTVMLGRHYDRSSAPVGE